MPDWIEIVRARLDSLGLDPEREEDIAAELAAHLEESYEDLLQQGIPENSALEQVLASVPGWPALCHAISRAEGLEQIMKRKYLYWLVILIPVTAYCFSYRPLDWSVGWHIGGFVLSVSGPQLVALVGLGILLSCWCQRAGGNRRDSLLAVSIFPIYWASTLLALTMISASTFQRGFALSALAGWMLNGILIPAVGLLAGWSIVMRLTRVRHDLPPNQVHGNTSDILAAPIGYPVMDMGLGRSPGLRFPWLVTFIALTMFLLTNFLNGRGIHGQALGSFFWKTGMLRIDISIPQLVALALLGRVLAHASRRSGGSWRAQIFIALFPAGWWLGSVVMVMPLSMLVNDQPAFASHLVVLSRILSQGVIPGVGLLVGALIAIWMNSRMSQPGQRAAAMPSEFPPEPSESGQGKRIGGHLMGWLQRFGASHA